MLEIERPVKGYRVEYLCDKCKKGYHKSNGVCYTVDPPHYPHTCSRCGCKKHFQ